MSTTYENLTATSAVTGKKILWTVPTKAAIFRACAQYLISRYALDPEAAHKVMVVIGFDAGDVDVYESLLQRLLRFIYVGHIAFCFIDVS